MLSRVSSPILRAAALSLAALPLLGCGSAEEDQPARLTVQREAEQAERIAAALDESEFAGRPVEQPIPSTQGARLMAVPSDCRFTQTHEWLKVDGIGFVFTMFLFEDI